MIRYNELLVLLRIKNLKKWYNIRIKRAGSDRVWSKNLWVFQVRFISDSGRENRVQNPKFLGGFGSGFRVGSIFDRSSWSTMLDGGSKMSVLDFLLIRLCKKALGHDVICPFCIWVSPPWCLIYIIILVTYQQQQKYKATACVPLA